MKQVTAFVASDGSLHADAAQCVAHEMTLEIKPLLEEFFESESRYQKNTCKMYMKILLRWETFKLLKSSSLSEAVGHVG
jgi:hypothetical protein